MTQDSPPSMFAPLSRKRRKPETEQARKAKMRKAGKAGKGQAKSRGDAAYYKALSAIAHRARWGQRPEESDVQQEAERVVD